MIISFLTFGRPIILPTASAAKFIVPHDPLFGTVTSTKQRDKECGAHEAIWRIMLFIKCAACEAELQIQNCIFTDIRLLRARKLVNFGNESKPLNSQLV